MSSSLFTQHKIAQGQVFSTALQKGKWNPAPRNKEKLSWAIAHKQDRTENFKAKNTEKMVNLH